MIVGELGDDSGRPDKDMFCYLLLVLELVMFRDIQC